MFDFNSIIPRTEFKYWFDRTDETHLTVLLDGSEIGTVEDHEDGYTVTLSGRNNAKAVAEISEDFNRYQSRPEYSYGKFAYDATPDVFDTLICGFFYLKYSEDKAPALAKRCLDWLHATDFYKAPASTQYHDSVEGGLVFHSINVYNKMIELLNVQSFCKVKWEDALITALVHDWCKIGLYESYMKNVKNDATGQWEQKLAFRHTDTQIPMGHGTTSMFMANKFLHLSTEQALAIRWHMGVYQVSDTEKPDLFRSNEKYPMVYLLQFADQLSITTY